MKQIKISEMKFRKDHCFEYSYYFNGVKISIAVDGHCHHGIEISNKDIGRWKMLPEHKKRGIHWLAKIYPYGGWSGEIFEYFCHPAYLWDILGFEIIFDEEPKYPR